SFVLTLSCADRPGIVAAVASLLADNGCNITDSAQFGDVKGGRLFIRESFSATACLSPYSSERIFAPSVDRFPMTAEVDAPAHRTRVLILVSKFGHCLNDLLYQHGIGALPIEIPAIVSNHRDFYRLAANNNIPFHHLPVTAGTKEKQEQRLIEIVEE